MKYSSYFIKSYQHMILIHQLAKKTGIPIHTIRYYEKYGLFKGKKEHGVKTNNYTYYDDEITEKLELIKEAKVLGFSLAELKNLIDGWYSNRLSVERKKEILELKIKEIDARIANLKSMKKLLQKGIKEVEDQLC